MSVEIETVSEDEEIFDDTLYEEEEDYSTIDHVEINIDDYGKLDEKDITEICLHKNSTTNNGVEVCSECGIEIYKELSLEPE